MRKLRNILSAALMITLMSGCAMYDQIARPRPWGLAETPDGSPMFKKGWEDGCDTGLAVYGNDRYKVAYDGFKQDPKLLLNDEYYTAWKDAYTYCRWYVYNWVRPSRK